MKWRTGRDNLVTEETNLGCVRRRLCQPASSKNNNVEWFAVQRRASGPTFLPCLLDMGARTVHHGPTEWQ